MLFMCDEKVTMLGPSTSSGTALLLLSLAQKLFGLRPHDFWLRLGIVKLTCLCTRLAQKFLTPNS